MLEGADMALHAAAAWARARALEGAAPELTPFTDQGLDQPERWLALIAPGDAP